MISGLNSPLIAKSYNEGIFPSLNFKLLYFSLNKATLENEVLFIDSYMRFLEISSKLIEDAPGIILFPSIKYFLILSLS